MSRATQAYASNYQLDRIHTSRLVRGDVRPLIANFNGAMDKARSIVSATWRVTQPQGANLSDAAIDGKRVAATLTAGIGCSSVKCEATLDNGQVLVQRFWIGVSSGPWYQGESTPPATGPYSLTVTA